MKQPNNKFDNYDIFYVTTDIKRALGPEKFLKKYHIICSSFDPLIPLLRKNGVTVFCLEEEKKDTEIKSAGNLLKDDKVINFISTHSKRTPHILYFKPSLQMDEMIKKLNYVSLGNDRSMSDLYEDKVNFYEQFIKIIPEFIIPSVTGVFQNLSFSEIESDLGERMVVQFGKGWAGNTTFYVESESEFENLRMQFKETKVRISKFIEGETILNNACVAGNTVYSSHFAYQISGKMIPNGKFGKTYGREWRQEEEKDLNEKVTEITRIVGKEIQKEGYKGYFGLDFIKGNDGRVYISELNARFTASCPFYTYLEKGKELVSLFEHHIASFMGTEVSTYEGAGIQGCEMTIDSENFGNLSKEKIEPGTYEITDGITKINDGYNPSNLMKNQYVFLPTIHEGTMERLKIQTNYEVVKEMKRNEMGPFLKSLTNE